MMRGVTLPLAAVLVSWCTASAQRDWARAMTQSDQAAASGPASFALQTVNVSFNGSSSVYDVPVTLVTDRGRVVATYLRRDSAITQAGGAAMGEINLLAPTYDLAPAALPPLPRYGWAYLWGARATTIPWLDCCSETGDVQQWSITVAADGTAVTVVEHQQWWPNSTVHPGRNATSTHVITLSLDPQLGYVGDINCSLSINAPPGGSVEFTNFLAPRLANPLHPAPSTITAWVNGTDASGQPQFVGFAENLLAGAMLGTYSVTAGGFVATLVPQADASAPAGAAAAAAGWSPAISQLGPADTTFLQQTCPTWMDQHQVVQYPAAPSPETGMYELAPRFRLFFLSPAATAAVLQSVTVVTHNGSSHRPGTSAMLRLGVLEDFEQQPVPLTQPLRALVQAYYQPDYVLAAGQGRDGGTAWQVTAASPGSAAQFYAFANPQPLVPLPAAAQVNYSAWVRPAPANATASVVTVFLSLSWYEADDFNVQARFPAYLSANATAAGQWQQLSLTATTPPFVTYGDIRVVAITQPASGVAGGTVGAAPPDLAFVDDWFFGVA